VRILLVNKYAHVTGGADRLCLALAGALRELGHEVALLSTASGRNVEDSGAFIALSVTHQTRAALGPPRATAVFGRALWNRSASRAMRALLRDFRPDVVHTHKLYPQLSVAPVLVARRAGVPVVQTLHDYEFMAANPLDARGARLDRREARPSYRALNDATFLVRRHVHAPAVDRWIAVSDYVANTYAQRGIQSTVIANFADVEPADPTPLFDRHGIVFLGTLSVEKGAQDVLRLAEAVPEHSVVVAGRGPLEALVTREAERLANLDFRGHLEPPAATELVRSALAIVVPSRWEEPGALVALEAMAVGTPVVAYRRGGLSEYVSRSGAGLVVEADTTALTAAVRRLLDDQDLWRTSAAAGLQSSRTMFSKESHTNAVLAEYERACASR